MLSRKSFGIFSFNCMNQRGRWFSFQDLVIGNRYLVIGYCLNVTLSLSFYTFPSHKTGAYPSFLGQRQGKAPWTDGPFHHRGNFWLSNSPKPTYLEETQADTGRTSKLHTESGSWLSRGPSCCVATVLTTEPLCRPLKCYHLFQNVQRTFKSNVPKMLEEWWNGMFL